MEKGNHKRVGKMEVQPGELDDYRQLGSQRSRYYSNFLAMGHSAYFFFSPRNFAGHGI